MAKHKLSGRNPHRFERTIHSYDRRSGWRQPSRCILIVCEGAETEPNYFKNLKDYLKLSTIQVKIINRGGAPITLIDEVSVQIEKREKEIQEGRMNAHEFEGVWCVFDVENPNDNQTFDRAVQAADQRYYHLAVSNPAFEYWYLLHFDPATTRPFANGREVKTYLQRFIPDYHEAMSIFNQLKDSTQKAIQRARNILENRPKAEPRFPNPSTQVYLLVEEMIEMSPSGCEQLRKQE